MNTQEEWRPAIGHYGYEVSSHGNIRSIDRLIADVNGKRIRFRKGVLLKPKISTTGCLCVYLGRHFNNAKVHRVVCRTFIGLSDNQEVDHIDRNRKNNRASNLRPCTSTQNHTNTLKQSNNKSGYKGVCWDKKRGKWLSQIAFQKKHFHLGRYDRIEDAARAYDSAATKYFGEFARLNFPKP